jgi:hypothetical protein
MKPGRLAAFVTVAVLYPRLLYGQACALCYQSAAASGGHFIQALRSGILVLLAAPVIVCIGIAALAYRKRGISAND